MYIYYICFKLIIENKFKYLLILRVFISFTKQFFTFHSNRVKCEKHFLPSVEFEPTTSCIRGKRFNARPQGPHSRERITPRLI